MDAVFTRKNKYRNFLTNMTGNSRQVIILLETVFILVPVNAAANHTLRIDGRVSKNLAILGFHQSSCAQTKNHNHSVNKVKNLGYDR